MEELCAPTRRYQDLLEYDSDDDDDPFRYTELELAVPVEDFLINRWEWKDLRAFLTGGAMPRILWIADNAFLVIEDEYEFDFDGIPHECIRAGFELTGGLEQTLTIATIARADMPRPTGAYSVFWRAITTSNCVKLWLSKANNLSGLPSGPVLSQFLQRSPLLQTVAFCEVVFEEEHSRALATLQRTDLEVKFSLCTFEPQDEEDAFIEWFRHTRLVTELDRCFMDSSIICALNGNRSVKKLGVDMRMSKYDEEVICVRSLLQALPGNMGIEHLTIRDLEMKDETCSLLIRSLATHPRITFLSVPYHDSLGSRQPMPAEAKSSILSAMLQMLHLNTVVQIIELPGEIRREAVYQYSILPRLEMNRNCFAVQRQAVKRADPFIRPQLLGRALHAVRYNPNLVFLFLSENVPAFVRTGE
jgi:hypothetical protein